MNKHLKTACVVLLSLSGLSACAPTGQIFGGHIDAFKDDNGNALAECRTDINPVDGKRVFDVIPKSQANTFWIKHNLPKGTLYYVCEGEKAVLPKDCEGNSLTTPQIRKYWRKHNLPVGTRKFDCSTGVPQAPQYK